MEAKPNVSKPPLHGTRRTLFFPYSLALQGPQLNLVVKGKEGQEALGFYQPEDVKIAPHVGPLGDKDAVHELQAVRSPEWNHHHVAFEPAVLFVQAVHLWSVGRVLQPRMGKVRAMVSDEKQSLLSNRAEPRCAVVGIRHGQHT